MPADVIKDVKPKFKYVVQRPKEIVFVIDVSTRENVSELPTLIREFLFFFAGVSKGVEVATASR